MEDERVSYSSLCSLEKKNTRLDEEAACEFNMWDAPDESVTSCSVPKPLKQDHLREFDDETDFLDGELLNDSSLSQKQLIRASPQVNLKNVLSGIIAILLRRTNGHTSAQNLQNAVPDTTFLGPEKNGDYFLHPSVYIPSAPPLFEPFGMSYGVHKAILEAEPPDWLPDSVSTACMQCNAPFTPLTRGRHHCRFCGAIFCRTCTKGRCLLPAKFRETDPQRVCDACYDRLDPLQGVLINSISNAVQVAKHDVMDWTSMRSWLNMPVGLSMEQEIYKTANTLRSYCKIGLLNPEKSIPQAVLNGANGLAILTVAKAGVLTTYKVGTGLVVVRRSDGSWSAPSAILSLGLGWGAQIGGGLTDFVIVLRDLKAVKTFCSRIHFSLGAGLGVAAGPLGRVVEADLRAGDRGSGMCYTYSSSKGAFVGVSLEGNFVATRIDTNLRFYGDPYLTTNDILLGMVESPRAAAPLYSALQDLYSTLALPKLNC